MMTVNFFMFPFGIKSSHCIFSLKTHKMFSVPTTLDKFEKATIISQFGKKSWEGKSGHLDVIVFEAFSNSSSLQYK